MVLVVVEVIDMGDLDVIRLAVADIISKESIAQAEIDVKGKFVAVFLCGEAGGRKRPKQRRWFGLSHEPSRFVLSKRRLEQVRPDSAFWSSEMSMEMTWKPRASRRVRVLGKDAGKMIVPPSARALAE
jgi:hypothetical protein